MEQVKMKRSEKLKPELYKKFKAFVAQFDNYSEAAAALGVHINTVPRILELKRCSQEMRMKIEAKLNAA